MAKRSLVFTAVACLLSIAVFTTRFATTAHALTTLSQGYTTTDKVSIGSIVSLKDNTSDRVDAANPSNVNSLLGIVINGDTSLLSVTNGQANQIQVATSGVAQVLVSDINGDINKGDYITASPISGVGMKATTSAKSIGIAQDDLTGKNSTKQSYTEKGGQKHDVQLGQIPLLVNVAYYYKQPDKTLIPLAIQNVANSFAGKKVNSMPILISAGIFLITVIVTVSIIYSMIKSSIISVGRNPMSQSAIYRNIVQMSGIVVGILVVSTVSIYMILRTF